MRTSADWLQHFQLNQRALLEIPWDSGPELTPPERAALGRSIAEFQRGESSEGRHLIHYAECYARERDDVDYARAIRLFIAEEQRHAHALSRFLGINGLPLARGSIADTAFRRLRNLFGTLEVSIAILILAEIIAQVYYHALHAATTSRILRSLCEQLLRDEAYHVEFQAEQLGKLWASRGRALYAATLLLQRVVFFGTCLVVWFFHAKALRRGHYGLRRFWRSAWQHFNQALQISSDTRTVIRAASGAGRLTAAA
ncbi:MAG TPA: hypothetical protein VHJ69_08740 [Gemmatimonadales bacterium]|jgi:rubrerythrin|nr:hypothetical protein [Gemmatimonadales bacterium]